MGRHLVKEQYQYSALAYLISRRGMANILSTFMEHGRAKLPLYPPHAVDNDGGFPEVLLDNYLAVPPLFFPHGRGTCTMTCYVCA
jgi:hypothetical protein